VRARLGADEERPARNRTDRLVAALLFLAACALVFPNLGDRRLWQDEAETALIAANVLRTGVPSAWDGRILATQNDGREMTDAFLWAWTPWLQHYVAAFGMAVLGESSLGARWPFALLGCLSVPLFHGLVLRLTRDRLLAVLTAILMLTSVQYLLLLRQCRYYALLPVLFSLSLWGYARLPSRRGVAQLSLGLALMFHGNPISSAMAATGFLLHAALFRRRDRIWPHLVACGLFLGAASVPWVAATGLLERAAPSGGFGPKLAGTLIMSNRYVCPWLVLAALAVAWRRKRSGVGGIDGLCLCLLAPMFLFLPWLVWPNPRYVPFLLPVGALIVARAIRDTIAWRPWAGAALAALAIGSNVLVTPLPALIPTRIGRELSAGELETGADARALGWWRSEIGGYAFELTHSIRGPDEELVAFIEAHTDPDDVIYVTNDWLPVMFHTRRRFAGVIRPKVVRKRPGWDALPAYLSDASRARWLILRPQHPLGSDPEARARFLGELERGGARVERTLHLDVRDVNWINRPMLSKHVFRMPEGAPNGLDVLVLARSP
jgi:hypothetical protein